MAFAQRLFRSSALLRHGRHPGARLSWQAPHRRFSTKPSECGVRILYASQTGTAQMFAHELAEGLEDAGIDDVTVQGCDEESPSELLAPGRLNLLLASCSGKGEPPDNAREFYEWVMNNPDAKLPDDVNYAVFGLGNESAHPNNYNIVGKRFDARLAALGGRRVKEMGLGDDGGCIEGDFDDWMEGVSEMIKSSSFEAVESAPVAEIEGRVDGVKEPAPVESPTERPVSEKYPTLTLEPAANSIIRRDLFHLTGANTFYMEKTAKLKVIDNRLLTSDAGESSLHELRVSLAKDYANENITNLTYETGDHLCVYPRNSEAIVNAYVEMLGVDPHAIISESNDEAYPLPTGITIAETLSHCIDLGAPPSPRFARLILGRKEIDYVNEIADPRRTVIDLCLEAGTRLALEDLLHNAVPMKPRYYSIASSSLKHPDEIHLVYRPVHYMTSKGYLREGTCTGYMTHKGAMQVGDDDVSCLPALINPNPSFRLPKDPTTPVLFIGGGCGVAPIRAFIQERVALAEATTVGPAIMYMGYRNPQDEAYKSLIKKAMDVGALTESNIVYYSGCDMPGGRYPLDRSQMFVSDMVRMKSKVVWDLIQSGGCIYICGGAKTFGAKIDAALIDVIQERGGMDFDGALQYLRDMVNEGRLMEDLSN